MSITVGLNKPDYAYVVIDGTKKIISKSVANFDFAKGFNVKTSRFTDSGKADLTYNAFPYFIAYGTKLIGIYSEGAEHGDSDRQIMVVGSKSADGQSFNKVTFFEQDTGVYDFSLLEGVVPDGVSIVLKVWTIKNTGGVFSATVNSSVVVGGLTYALWGDVVTTGGVLYRTGYSYGSDDYNTALFTSSDKGQTWVFKSIIAEGTTINNHFFNEAGLYYIGSGDFVAVIRNDYDGSAAGDNALYISKSLDYGATWSAPVLLETSSGSGEYIRGRQPKLTRINTVNYMALTISKRIGTSGAAGGKNKAYGDRTGIQLWISTDNGTTWGESTMIDSIFSTDGGQPWAVSYDANRIFIPYYSRKSEDEGPDIYSIALDTTGLEL